MKIIATIRANLTKRKKQQEHQKLIEALKRPESQLRRPAAKFASNRFR